ncbi:ATP-binding protein [Geomesophilobacter sediminis]|uniref:histidine kinase n=1 Tax=Geomesophilobacter sediminis TaxID=2798584 RepID=A0A8J7JEA3_9BACT|nr:ATP-binding protein [Geomesophilobacter sediminis]MBJ6724314.1 PAS domain-containing protein [Geomesophilobacter sediminis]
MNPAAWGMRVMVVVLAVAAPFIYLNTALYRHGASEALWRETQIAASIAFLLALVLMLIDFWCHRAGTRTLQRIAEAAARIGTGEGWSRLGVSSGEPAAAVAAVLNEVALRIDRDLARTKAEKNRLNAILRGMGEGILVVEPSGNIILVNPALRELLSLTESVVGRPLIDISRHPVLHETFRHVMATKTERIEELQLKNTADRIVLTHWVPLTETGALQGVVVVFHDISDIRRLENMRKDFVANVSHELRTPIAIIRGYAETLTSGGPVTPEQSARFLSIILAHSERLASLVGDLLTLSQLESGSISLDLKKVQLGDLAAQVVSLLEQKSQAKGIAVTADLLHNAPPVLADPARVEQVLVNLLDNAIKYTTPGGDVTVSYAVEANLVRVGVHDTGIGIPSRDLPRIFERFYRADSGRSRDEGGTGLGLSIVKHLVQMQGGSVSVESSSRGSSFFFTLKRALGNEQWP